MENQVQQPASRSRAFRIAARGAVVCALAVFGAWMVSELRPLFAVKSVESPHKPDAPSLTQPAIVTPAGRDPQTSLLGTDSSLSEKPLQLVLVATSVGQSLEDSTASLGTDPRNPQTYAGGAVLANGARIEEIRADRIVLRQAGRRAELLVDHAAPARVAMNQVVNDERQKKGYPVLTPTLAEGGAGPTSIGGTKGAKLDRVASSREDLSAVVRPMPVFEKDKLTGFRLVEGTSAGQFASLGLETGDVLRSVDGKLISSDAAWSEVDDALSTGATIVVGIERNGSLSSMTLDGARLMQSADSPPPRGNDPPARL